MSSNRYKILLKFNVFVFCFTVFIGIFLCSNSFAQNQQQAETEKNSKIESATSSDYVTQGIAAGVWNDGQAALWDLNIIDHFHYFGPSARARGYKPTQPIKFSHITHVQKHKIECQLCHWNVAKSPYASIPEVETCAGCHNKNGLFLGGQTEEQKAEIAKLQKYIASGEPIPWEKVHVMPDHVRFDHRRHVKAGVSCQSCHGQIPEMEEVERVSSMKMGWCVSCHREKGTSIDCYVCHK